MMASGNAGKDTMSITFKVPISIDSRFKAKCKQRGKRSRILRGLLQMWLEGKITEIVYKSEDRITSVKV